MRQVLYFAAVLAICVMLSGCVYHKVLVVDIKGDKVDAPIGSYTPIQGKNVSGKAIYQSFITDEKGRAIPKLADINVEQNTQNTSKVGVVN